MKTLYTLTVGCCILAYAPYNQASLFNFWRWDDQSTQDIVVLLNGISFLTQRNSSSRDARIFCSGLNITSAAICLSRILDQRQSHNPFMPGMYLMAGAANVHDLYKAW